MSIRTRLFLLFGGVMAILIVAEWWWMRTLTDDLSRELGEAAFSVGRSMASVLGEIETALGQGTTEVEVEKVDAGTTPRRILRRIVREEEVGGIEAHIARVDCEDPEEAETSTTDCSELDLLSPAGEGKLLLDLEPDQQLLTIVVAGSNLETAIPVPSEGIDRSLERFSRRLYLGSVALVGLGLVALAFVAHRETRPLRRLAQASLEVGHGALGTRVPQKGSGSGEVGQAIAAFNIMSEQLEALDEDARILRGRQHLSELGEVARGLAHTLRNPLNAVGLSLEELATRAGDDDEAWALVESARGQIRRMDRSIRSFLALASTGAGVSAVVDLGALARDVVLEALQDVAGRVRIRLQEPGELPSFVGVEPELRAVFQALVVNAVEVSPDGGQVHVGLEPLGELRVRLEVTDQGPGVPPEIRERLFTPHLTTKTQGSGMGLFLAHRIATTRYSGSLELGEGPEGGTVARLELESSQP